MTPSQFSLYFLRQTEANNSIHDGQIEDQRRHPKGNEIGENDEITPKEEVKTPKLSLAYLYITMI